MTRKTTILLILFVALLGACSPSAAAGAHPTTLTDGSGRTVTLDLPAQRVLSLAPSNTEILFAIGAGSQLVGRDTYSDYPPEAKAVTDIGGLVGTLNTELILSKKPDLVLASPLTPPEQIADLDKAGLKTYVVPNPMSFNDLYANLATVGQLTGHEKEAAALVDSLKARVNAVTGKVANVAQHPMVYYELDATDPTAPYTSGPDTFVDLLIRTAGGENFGGNLKGDWVQVSLETVLMRQPDLILLGDNTYGGVTPEQVNARAGWDALNAVKQDKVFIFDDNTVSRPGPRLVDGLEAMAKLLHPELFK
ncbi:MAG TPA: cobalamin-binding protein [Anaerolineales bacterium]|nr:cobalamin-binding protein [Anaerolineales bacterium]